VNLDHHRNGLNTVLFDLGSTLIYFNSDWQVVMPEAIGALYKRLIDYGYKLDNDEFNRRFGQALQEYYVERDTEFIEYTTTYLLNSQLEQWGYHNLPESHIMDAVRAFYEISERFWYPEADAVSTLQILKDRGYQMGIVSNAGDDQDVQDLVDKAEIRNYLEVILSSAAVGIRKPNPKIFNLALEKMGASPSRAAMVGDTLGADILGAQNAGLLDIWITRRADTPANNAHLDTIQPTYQIESLAQLPDLLPITAAE
jgi:HAD superfamily hydrolase (TIGR01662 family)